jgi:antitoxin component of RelBE/YafQ-DinJ toxin-antitoxin module
MSVAKKEAGSRALRALGMTASEAINAMYDHLIEYGTLPLGSPEKHQLTREERMAQSIRRVDAIHKVEVSPDIQRMSIKDARRARLRGRGLADDASLAE